MPKLFWDFMAVFMLIFPILLITFYLIYKKTGRCEWIVLDLGSVVFAVGFVTMPIIGLTYFLN